MTTGIETEPPRILLVEDNELTAGVLIEMLRASCRARIRHVATARAALGECKHTVFDLLVLDVCLPDIDGVRLARMLRGRGLAVPLLFATGTPWYVSGASLVELQPAAVLTKPVSWPGLVDHVLRFCPRASAV